MSNKMRLRMHSLSIFYFAITLTVLLISPLSLFLQTSSFSLSLDLDSSDGDQAVQSLVVPPPPAYRIVSIQIFGTDVQSMSRLSVRFEYDGTQVVYAGFDASDVLPNPDVMVSKGINPTSVEITMSSGDSAMVNSGLIGTIHFRTTDAFSETEIRLVRAELVRDGTSEIMMLAHSVNLQVSAVLFPDFDGNGKVDVDDFRAFSGAYGSRRGDAKYKSSFDLDGDGEIGLDDFQIFINSYGKVAPVAVGTLAPMLLGEHPVTVDISGNFSDADSDTLRYAAVSSADSVATASVDGHAVTIHPVTVGVATITVTATDADGLHAMQDITVTVRFSLAFAASTTRRALDENTPPGEQIGEPVAVRGFNSLTYSLSGTDADSFAIDARTGQIQTREDISYDFETKNSYWMTVEANDGQGGTASIVVIIKINDVEEPPSSPPSNFWVRPDNESLTVHYSAVSDEQGRPPVRGYHAEIRRGENGPWGTRKTIYGRTNTSVYYHHIDPEEYHSRILVNGQVYQVRVRAYNSEGASGWSAPVSGTPVYVPPKETPKLAQFQDEDDRAQAVVDLSHIAGEGGRIIVTRAALPATIPQEEVEGVFLDIVEVAVSDAPDVPANAGFTLPTSSSFFNIELKARINNRDVDIGDALQASVEICLPVPAEVSDPVIIHYDEGASAWEMLDRQRVEGDVVCGYTDMFSLFGVVEIANRAPVVVGAIVPQTLRVGGEGVTVDVSGKFSDPDDDVLTYTAASDDEAIATVAVSGSMVTITPVSVGTMTITVTATDAAGSNQTVAQTIAVRVNKAYEKLSFGGATMPAQTYTVGVQITDLQLPEAMGGTGTINYTLTPALPAGLALDTGTRTIRGIPTSAIEITEYKWRATDADENTVELTFSITVAPSNRAPHFTSGSTFNVQENTTAVGKVVAEDTDIGDSITGYEVTGGADEAQFEIDSSTGVLAFKTAPDYERPKDVISTAPANEVNDNAYIVVVEVKSGTGERELAARQTITVTATDVTEPPGKPSAPTVTTSTLNSLTVEWTEPDNIGPAISSYDVRYILSSANDGDKADDSKWTVQTDAWTSGSLAYTISSLNQNTSYDVQVRAESDEGTGAWSDSVVGTTAQNQAPVITSASSFTVSENITTAATVGTVTAEDADSQDNITGYAIVTGADGSQFSIVEATGVLTFKAAPDYESPTDVSFTDATNAANNNSAENNEYIVIVTATGGAGSRALTVRDTLKVTVTDVNEPPGKPSAPTVSTSTVNSLTVSWSAPTNTGTAISAYDVRYIPSSASDENKADDNNWTVVADAWTSGTLAYTISSLNQNTSYDIQVRAENDEGTGAWSDSGSGTTAQNQAPVFASVSPISVAENSTVSVATVSATDADSQDNITGYDIVTGGDGSQFSIVAATGVLTFKTAPNYEDPTDVAVTDPSNSASNNEYIVIVTATSGENTRALTSRDTLKVTVTDVTEPPGKPSAPTVSTSTVNSLTVSWSAPTNTGPEVSAYDVRYILSSASDENKADDSNWTVQTDAWTSGDLEYTISSLPQNTSYDIQVRAENAEGTGAWSDSGSGTTAQNQAPVFASVSSISVAENSTVSVATVSATDADASDSITGYAIVTGADGSQFSIVEATGVLTFKATPDYESPTDVAFTDATNSANNNAAENNEYIVIVTATSGAGSRALTVRDTLKVTVTDVNEVPGKPSAPTVSASTVNSLTISWSAPTNTGPAISAYDVRYILSSASDENKADDTNWTVVMDAWTGGSLEYTISSRPQNTSYDIQVRAESDEGTGAWSSSVKGTTVQNQAPVIASISPISVAENSTVSVATVSATDADTDDSITGYAIVTGGDGSQFSIVAATGVLAFKTSPNYEDPKDVEVTDPSNAAENNEYIVVVSATSGANARALTSRDTLKVTVTDVNEVPGKPSAPTVSASTVNSLTISWSAPTNTGPEVSAYDVRYILTSASNENKADDTNWTVQADAWTSGDLEYTISSLNQNTSYDIQVRAESDEGTSAWSSSVKGTTAQNRVPVFASVSPISVAENSTGTIVTVSATDADTDDSITGYAIVTGADGSQFSIVEATGVLTFKTAPNYESPTDVAVTDPSNAAENNEYIVVISATGGANARALTARQTITVTVTDVTEPPGKPSAPSVVDATVNSLKVSWSAPTNTGPVISAYDVRYILSSASDQNKADDTNWTVQADAWTSGSLEYTIGSLNQNTSYDVQVRAESDEGTGAWSSSVKGTTAQNQAPVFTSASSFTVSENITTATTVGTVTAEDADASDSITGYAIVTGADGSQFSIVEATGVLTFQTAPNYEDPKDVAVTDPSNAAENNEYIVIVSVTSGTSARELTAKYTLKVTVTDVNEPPGKPSAPSVVDATVNSLKVSWSAPTNTGPEISAYDVRYIFTSASNENKADNSNWTVQTDAWTSGDFEYTIGSLPQNTGYDIQVRAKSDEGTGAWSDSGSGATAQNQAPVFTSASSFTVSENITTATTVGTVTAEDADASDSITGYAIVTGGDGSQFSIVEATGVLTFKTAPNYEDPKDVEVTTPSNDANNNEYIVVVEVTGGANARALTARQTITVTVTDVNEAPGKPSAPTVASATFNSLKVSWSAPTNTGPVISAYDVRYILTSASASDKADDNNWTVQTDAWTSGSLEYTISSLPQNTSYDVQVRAESDEDTGAWSDSVTGMTGIIPGICGRTSQVQSVILAAIDDVTDCALVTDTHLSRIRGTLDFRRQNITAVKASDFSGLSSLRSLRLDINKLSTLPAKVFSGLSNLETLRLNDNKINTLPASVFSGLSSPGPTRLTLDNNPGAPFTLTLQLERTDNMDLTAEGPATIKVKVAEGAPFDMTVGLSVTGGTLTNADGSVTEATLSAGSTESAAITVTQSGSQPVRVSLTGNPPAPPTRYAGLNTALGLSLVLFGEFVEVGICGRTSQVQSVILAAIDDVTDCALVTEDHLALISSLNLHNSSISTLLQNDFSNLSKLQNLWLYDNDLGVLPDGIFSGLSNLQTLHLDSNNLSTLPDGIFSGLSNLQTLSLGSNGLSTLPEDIFSDLSSLQILNFNGNGLSTLPEDIFSDLSSLQILNFNGNGLSTLPADAFSGLSNLQSLYFNGNGLSTLPAGVFSDLSSLRRLDLSDNTGAPFTLTLQLERTDNMNLTAAGPATIKVKVAEGAPFDMTVGLSVTGGTLTNADGSVTEATLSAGSTESAAITVTQSGSQPVRVSLAGKAPAPPMAYAGLNTALGSSLVLFGEAVNRAPVAVGLIATQTVQVDGNAVMLDVSIYFSDPNEDDLTYEAVSSDEDVVTVAVSDAAVEITPQGAGSATVTVTASDPGSLSATQEMAVSVKNTPPVVAMGLTDQTASAGNAFTYTFPTNAFSDVDSDALTYTSSGQPTWLTFTANTRTYSGTPPDTNGSPFAITVTANDGKGSKVQATFILTIPIGICDRTAQIQTALLSVIDGVSDCSLVTDAHLSGIVDSLNLRSKSITALKATDFSGLSSLRILNLYDNDLIALPTGVFSGLSNLRFLSLYDNDLTELPTGVFSGLSNLRFLSLDNNEVSTLPDNVFSNLSNLQTLSLGGNGLSTLPAGVFSGLSNLRFLSLDNNEVSTLPDNVFSNLSSLRRLDLSDNTGAPFTLTLVLDRTDNTDLTTAGPATIKVKVAEGAPFDMTVGLSVTNGTLTGENGSVVTEAMISAGSTESAAITVTQSGSQRVTVSLTGNPPAPPMAYAGLTTALGRSLVLFSVNRAPEAVGTIPAQTLTATGDPETTGNVTLDVSSYFSDPDNDTLTYGAESNNQVALAFAINSDVTIIAVSEGTATVTVTARDATGSNMSVDQTIAVTVTVSSAELCDRTSQVQSAILSEIEDVIDCALVKQTHLSGIKGTLDFRRQNITAVKASDFSGLSRLRVLRLDRNELSSLPAKVFSGLSKLETLRLNHNKIKTLPDSVFFGLSSPGPTRLTLNNNSGAPFTLTLQLERTDNMDLTAVGPATIKVKVAEGAPFDMTVGLSVTGGTLTNADGSVTEATLSAGSTESAAITVTQWSGSQQVTVSLTGNSPSPPEAYEGLNTALGSSLVLF